MAGETGGIGPTNLIPQQQVPVADATYVKPPVAPQIDPNAVGTEQPVATQPQDQSKVAQTGTANTQVALVDPPAQQETAPPLQPAADEPDLPSPPSYSFHNTQVINAFKEKHGRRVLSAQTGESMAAAVLGQLGIDPGNESAVRRLQLKIGAYPDGKFGPETWGKAIAYLSNRHDRGDAYAQDALAVLLTPTAKGGGDLPVPTRTKVQQPQPTQEPDPNGQTVDPNAQQEQQPAELTESQIHGALDEPANQAMNKQLDDASWMGSDDVAENNLSNPSALFVMQPKTVARNIKSLISGWTTDGEKEAMMKGIRKVAATGELGATLENLDIGDLKDELSSDQLTELKSYAADPNSGVSADQLKKINS
jgi:hypothetical protein